MMEAQWRTKEQEMAKYAWEEVNSVKDKSWAKEYRSIVLKAPSLILACGLGQTLAFLLSKAEGKMENAHGALYAQISKWTAKEVYQREGDLLQLVMEGDAHKYRLATMEVLSLLGWIKRFTEALIERGEEE